MTDRLVSSPAMSSHTPTDTRQRLLDAAEELVNRQGFAATSIDQILEQVGVTKGAFFHHFKTKNDLARALIQRFAEADRELLTLAVEASSGQEKWRAKVDYDGSRIGANSAAATRDARAWSISPSWMSATARYRWASGIAGVKRIA